MSTFYRTAAPALTLCMWLCPGSVVGETYRGTEQHYTLTLPSDWVEMTADEIKKVNQIVGQRAPGKSITYETGFQLRGKQLGSFPYILVQWQPGAPPGSYEAIEQEVARASSRLSNPFMNLQGTVSDVALDRRQNRIMSRTESNQVLVGKVVGVSGSFLGKDGVLSLHCYEREKYFSASLNTFNRILDSFEFDPGYTYKPTPEVKFDWNSILGKSIIGGLVGGAVGGVIALWSLLTKKKSSDEAG